MSGLHSVDLGAELPVVTILLTVDSGLYCDWDVKCKVAHIVTVGCEVA